MRTRNSWTRTLAICTVTSILSFGFAAASQAVNWGTISVSYDGTTRATAYGSFTNKNPLASNAYTLNDVSRDNNNSYGDVAIYFGPKNNVPNPQFKIPEYDYFQTPVTVTKTRALTGGVPAHAASRVCVQLGWPVPDRCSGWADVSFSY